MNVDETKLGVDVGVNVGLVCTGYGFFGGVDDVEMLGGVNVIARKGLVVRFAHCRLCISDLCNVK
jgi:hypothetical protein